MVEIIKCPNCNANIHIAENSNTAKCEYCDTEIILNENKADFDKTITKSINYQELKTKWNISVITADIIQVAIAFIFFVLMDSRSDMATGIGILVLIVSAVYSVALPVHFAHKRPINPAVKNPSKLSTGIMLYGLFLLSFALTIFIAV